MGAPITFSFVFERAILIGPLPTFLEHWALRQWKHLFVPPVTKYKQMYFLTTYLFSLYTWELNLGETIWDKTKCYWEYFEDHISEHFGNLKTLWELDGTHWEPEEKTKNPWFPPPPQPLKRKKLDHSWVPILIIPIGYLKFLFPKLFITIFHLG
jgi:hypothetical protein